MRRFALQLGQNSDLNNFRCADALCRPTIKDCGRGRRPSPSFPLPLLGADAKHPLHVRAAFARVIVPEGDTGLLRLPFQVCIRQLEVHPQRTTGTLCVPTTDHSVSARANALFLDRLNFPDVINSCSTRWTILRLPWATNSVRPRLKVSTFSSRNLGFKTSLMDYPQAGISSPNLESAASKADATASRQLNPSRSQIESPD